MEIYTDAAFAENIIEQAHAFNIDAQIIGRVKASDKKELQINVNGNQLIF
jgi:phosphoribosylformylglycinamidine cyclo-ligase